MKGFQSGFLLFCLVWAIIRAVFWILSPLEDIAEVSLQTYAIFTVVTRLAISLLSVDQSTPRHIIVNSSSTLTPLYSLSINIQFATFTFLVLFYVHIVNKANWEDYKKPPVGWYIAINVFFVVVSIGTSMYKSFLHKTCTKFVAGMTCDNSLYCGCCYVSATLQSCYGIFYFDGFWSYVPSAVPHACNLLMEAS